MRERSVYSSSLQHRLEAETTHEREERLQQLSAAQVRSSLASQPYFSPCAHAPAHFRTRMRTRGKIRLARETRLEAETTHEREERLQH